MVAISYIGGSTLFKALGALNLSPRLRIVMARFVFPLHTFQLFDNVAPLYARTS